MKARIVICFLLLGLMSTIVTASDQSPIAISPGNDVGVAMVGQSNPTFSWSGVAWAQAYRVAVFETAGTDIPFYEDMAAFAVPVLSKEIKGQALSWTPSTDSGLINGSTYVWYVQAIDAYGAGPWSEGKLFKVKAALWPVEMDSIMSETLIENGVSEDAVPGIIRGIRSKVSDGTVGENDSPSGLGFTPSLFGIQGSETTTNTLFGLAAGSSLTSGVENTFYGYYAGSTQSTAHYNTFVGSGAGRYNTSGLANAFLGYLSGHANTTGDYNTFLGNGAGRYNTAGSNNTFLGLQAGYNFASGNENVFIGKNAGMGASPPAGTATGYNNICIGANTGRNISSGFGNIFLGYNAGYNETGSNKLYIDNSDTSSPLIWGDFGTDVVNINGKLGVGQTSPFWPVEVKTSGSNAVILCEYEGGAINYINAIPSYGNFGVVNNYPLRLVVNSLWRLRLDTDGSLTMRNGATCSAGGVWTDASSRDLKENINFLTQEKALEALEGLQPVTYNYKADKEDEHVGFIAEDAPELVASKDRKGMSPMDVVAVLTKVLQEQQKTIDELRQQVTELEAQVLQNK